MNDTKSQLLNMLSTFKHELATLNQMNVCECDACTKVGDLKLKQVVHVGEAAIEKIARSQDFYVLRLTFHFPIHQKGEAQ